MVVFQGKTGESQSLPRSFSVQICLSVPLLQVLISHILHKS